MCKIIAIANQKGGVTKTTTTFNLSASIAETGKKVLMIDLDSQASLTISAGLEPLDLKYSVCDILKKKPEETKNCIYELNNIPNLSIITSIIDLAALEMDLVNRVVREKILERALASIKEEYAFIFIDCAPQLSILSINALACCDYVIIPSKTSYLDFRGLEQLESTILDLKEMVNSKIHILGVIATLFEKNVKDHNEILNLLKGKYNVIGVIKKTIDAVRGIYEGIPVVLRNPSADISKEYVKIAEIIMNA
jgi:chromosome partitioning protein